MKYSKQVSTPRRLTSFGLAPIAGFLAHLAFPQASIWPLAIIGLALLFWCIFNAPARWAFFIGALWGLGHLLPLLWWAHEAVGWLPWVALSTFESLILALGPVMYVWLMRIRVFQKWKILAALPFSVTWVVAEQIRHNWPFGGFPWVRIAFSQVDGPLVHLAPYGGAPLVGLVVALSGALVAVAVMSMARKNLWRAPIALAGAASLIVGPLWINLDTSQEEGSLKVGAVQGNVSNPGLDAFANAREVTSNHVEGTLRLVQQFGQSDVVLWPENASDYDPRTDAEANKMVTHAAEASGAPMLVGTVRYTDETRFNEVVAWGDQGPLGAVYAKQVPAAFAEYIPLRDFIRPFAPVVDLVGVDMSAGEEPAFLDVAIASLDRSVRIATIICFEVAYDWLVQESVAQGAELLYVPTNNATFGETTESDQQFAMTRFRAVEFSRAAVQISTVGISGFVLPDGSTSSVTGLFTAEQIAADLPLRSTQTLAARVGQWPINILMGIVGVGVITSLVTHRVPVKKQRG